MNDVKCHNCCSSSKLRAPDKKVEEYVVISILGGCVIDHSHPIAFKINNKQKIYNGTNEIIVEDIRK